MEHRSVLDLLSYVGYLVIRWNYAEYFARQLLRRYAAGDSIFDPAHIELGKKSSIQIEEALKEAALPQWTGIGRPYLERLIECYSVAREHRNHIVHGIYMTVPASSAREAQVVVLPAKPHKGVPQAPSHVCGSEIKALADHFHDLAMYSREIEIGFDRCGEIALDGNGKRVMPSLPALLAPLPRLTFDLLGP